MQILLDLLSLPRAALLHMLVTGQAERG